jgi:antirestriction protein ArdC
MSKTQEIRNKINAQIVAALESGKTPPWKRPWCVGKNSGSPANVASKKAYRGINPLILDLASMRHDFTSRWWGTFNQWKAMGGMVNRRPDDVPEGQWGSTVVFWSPISKTVKVEDGTEEEDKFFVMKTFTVFNIDQVDGDFDHLRAGTVIPGDEAIEINYQPAQDAIDATNIEIRHGGAKAFYSPNNDFIQLPPKATFKTRAGYWETVFHEAIHATEHPSRLNWSRKIQDNSYGMGELIAEIGACYLSRELGIPATEEHMDSHVGYLAGWLKAMKGDSSFIFTAAAQASKASDYLLSFSRSAVAVPEAALVA